MAEDVFKERLNEVLRSISNIHNITKDVLIHGLGEVPRDANIIILLEAARANKLIFKDDTFVFKS